MKTKSNDELKESHIKTAMCYYSNDVIKIEYFHFHNILTDKNSYENVLVYDISYKTSIGAKQFCIRFDKEDPLKNLSPISVEFHWSHEKLLENDWNKWNL